MSMRTKDLLARLVGEVDGLVGESGGVAGLHLNGDVAPWAELLPGGRFERLSSLDEARDAAEEPDAPAAEDARAGALAASVWAVLASKGFPDDGRTRLDDAVLRAIKRAQPVAAPHELSDDRIDHIAENVVKAMPEGIRGFLKVWGWRQFARELLEVCAGHVRAAEPVGSVFTMEALVPGGRVVHHATLTKPLPAGAKLYARPVPAVPGPVNEALLTQLKAVMATLGGECYDWQPAREAIEAAEAQLAAGGPCARGTDLERAS